MAEIYTGFSAQRGTARVYMLLVQERARAVPLQYKVCEGASRLRAAYTHKTCKHTELSRLSPSPSGLSSPACTSTVVTDPPPPVFTSCPSLSFSPSAFIPPDGPEQRPHCVGCWGWSGWAVVSERAEVVQQQHPGSQWRHWRLWLYGTVDPKSTFDAKNPVCCSVIH